MAAIPPQTTWGFVYDPFLGSGTTIMCCEVLDRTCYGLEIVPEHCNEIIERWEEQTGKKAVKINDYQEAQKANR